MGRPKKKKEIILSDDSSIIKSELEKLGGKIMNSLDELTPMRFLSTGLFSFDKIVSDSGGIPGNSVVEIFGPNSTGKTSVALQIATEAQKENMKVYYMNAERAINSSIVNCFPALDPTKVDWIDPDTGESAIDIMKTIIKTQTDVLVILDSVPACLPSVMADASAGDSSVGRLAALFSPFMPEAKKWCRENNNILVLLNQERANIGPMARGGKIQPGGHAIKFYTDIRIKLVKRFTNGNIVIGGDTIGHIIEAKAEKTRWAPPHQTADLPLIYGSGFDIGRELLTAATLYSIVVKKGAWYSYFRPGEEEVAFKSQGEDKMAAWIRCNIDIQKEIKQRMSEILS